MIDRLRNLFLKRNCGNQKPNVFIILLDQFRKDALSSHPIFEKLKKQGVYFNQTITYAPYTLASCHATFTGMYGRENGVNAYTKSHDYDSKNCFTIAQYLREAGYYTRAYSFSQILIPHDGFTDLTFVHDDDEPCIIDSHKREIDLCYNQKKPFFSFLHYGEIHHAVLENVIKMYNIDDERYFGKIDENRKRYQAYTHEAGQYLEQILEYIEKNDNGKNTLVLVMTDHGGSNGEKIGEKAYGTFTYDYSINVWHYMVFPKIFPQNLQIDTQVRTIDILPTLLDLLGIKHNKNKKPLQGISLLPIIRQENITDRLAFSETGGVDGAYPSPDAPNVHCIRDGRWKLIKNSTLNKFELYDLKTDPKETNNLYSKEPEHANRMTDILYTYL